ncbi:hypothetical protein BH23ACT9_BH23ACT9_28200 [soil metagenome]
MGTDESGLRALHARGALSDEEYATALARQAEQSRAADPDRMPETVGDATATGRWRRRVVAVVVLLAWTLGAVLVGGALGYRWFLLNEVTPAPEVTLAITTAATDVPTDAVTAVSTVMPDLIGLPQTSALEALADLGLDPSMVVLRETPQVGDAGRVVAQEPLEGVRDPATATLTLSAVASMPDLVGIDEEQAVDALSTLGINITRVGVFDQDADVGTVISTSPAAGEPALADTTVTIATAPDAVFLTGLQGLNRSCSQSAGTVAGAVFDESIVCQARRDPVTEEYALIGQPTVFEATVGIDDRADLDAVVLFQVATESELLISEQITFGQQVTVSIALGDALRLRITTTLVGEDTSAVATVWGDARILGAPDTIDRLVTG